MAEKESSLESKKKQEPDKKQESKKADVPKDKASLKTAKTGKKSSKTKADIASKQPPSSSAKIDSYEFLARDIPVKVNIARVKGEFVPIYELSIASISRTTEFMLERIRQELIKAVSLEMIDITDVKKAKAVESQFEDTINDLISKYFPDLDDDTKKFLIAYLVTKSLGLGSIEFIMNDHQLEEIVINEATEPIWVYHKKHGWLKTNVFLRDEEQTRHYSSIIGRKVGRQITVLEPLLDAHLEEGDRVNATLMPISTAGNTITFRKFARDPWTIIKFINSGTLSCEAAALIWLAMQYEMSAIIAGGTASGKTSALNCFADFFPPNQRIISIEDTREIRLPKFLHWVPMNTRLPNAEGKGQITMEDLLVNSLRMRPDRIIVGEVRRKREAETLFEAIHTGHSVYATFHANDARQAVERLTNQPIDVPKIMLPAISLIIVQFRNRRTGVRRTFQIAEILEDSTANILMQYDQKKDKLVKANTSKSFFKSLKLFTGLSDADIKKDLHEKEKVLNYMIKHEIFDVDAVGRIIAEYYTDKKNMMSFVNSNKKFED